MLGSGGSCVQALTGAIGWFKVMLFFHGYHRVFSLFSCCAGLGFGSGMV